MAHGTVPSIGAIIQSLIDIGNNMLAAIADIEAITNYQDVIDSTLLNNLETQITSAQESASDVDQEINDFDVQGLAGDFTDQSTNPPRHQYHLVGSLRIFCSVCATTVTDYDKQRDFWLKLVLGTLYAFVAVFGSCPKWSTTLTLGRSICRCPRPLSLLFPPWQPWWRF
jgi:hypothetical protein